MITHRKNSNAGKRDNSRKSIKRLCNKTHEICDNIYVPFALLLSSVSNICPYFPSTIYRKGRKTQRHTMTPENWLETKQQSSSRWWALDSMSREKTLDSTHRWWVDDVKNRGKNSLFFSFCVSISIHVGLLILLFFFPSSVFLHRVSTSSRSVKKKCTELSYDAIMSENLLQRTLCVNMSYTLERCVGVRNTRELCKNENESNFFSHPRRRQTTQKGSESVIVKLRNFRSWKFRHLSSVSARTYNYHLNSIMTSERRVVERR